MNTPELITHLKQQGVELWVDHDTLNIRAPKGVITGDIQAMLSSQKVEVLEHIQNLQRLEASVAEVTDTTVNGTGLGLQTIGRLIGGFGQTVTPEYRVPIVNARAMAINLTITFRPLPTGYQNQVVIKFRDELEQQLQTLGATVLPWDEAATAFNYDINIPGLNYKHNVQTRAVKPGISAVIDVERPRSPCHVLKQSIAETIYQIYASYVFKGKTISIARIAKLIGWAEEHAAKYVQDPTNTQVITLMELDREFVDPNLPYQRKIQIGLSTLLKSLSELVIGVSDTEISILNMNLSDSIFPRSELQHFVLNSLIPKVFVPIMPLPLSRFDIGTYDPTQSTYAQQLVQLGQSLAKTTLFPPVAKLSQVIKRQSYRDIVNVLVNGRTGVSYGFVAFAEPPTYIGEPELSESDWNHLSDVEGFSREQLRQNQIGRRYVRLAIKGQPAYRQIPDLWLVSSRSGSNKTNLSLEIDVIRIGLKGKLCLELPHASTIDAADIKPSYDIYVMLGICLAAALYQPALIENGTAIVHFHGYPAARWFKPNEHCAGVNNPSVPCGTYESGVFNFLGIAELANRDAVATDLVCLLEPDHGANILAPDPEYLISRLSEGCDQGEIELGGKHFQSLRQFQSLESSTSSRS
jgi:hypothetical protein